MRILADSHALVWRLQRSNRLSTAAAATLAEAEATDGVVVSVATLIDLWYVAQTTRKVTPEHLAAVRDLLASSSAFMLHPIDVTITDETVSIPRATLADPWDRFIVATARALSVPLVTRDEQIRASGLVTTIW